MTHLYKHHNDINLQLNDQNKNKKDKENNNFITKRVYLFFM